MTIYNNLQMFSLHSCIRWTSYKTTLFLILLKILNVEEVQNTHHGQFGDSAQLNDFQHTFSWRLTVLDTVTKPQKKFIL